MGQNSPRTRREVAALRRILSALPRGSLKATDGAAFWGAVRAVAVAWRRAATPEMVDAAQRCLRQLRVPIVKVNRIIGTGK